VGERGEAAGDQLRDDVRAAGDVDLYTGPEMAEFDKACPRITVDLFPDGRGRRTEERQRQGGGSYATSPRLRDDERWMDRPAFGGVAAALGPGTRAH
jgi:hypothetical protein